MMGVGIGLGLGHTAPPRVPAVPNWRTLTTWGTIWSGEGYDGTTKWSDSSGNGNDLTVITAPSISTINGKSSVLFANASKQYFQIKSGKTYGTCGFTASAGYLIAALKLTSVPVAADNANWVLDMALLGDSTSNLGTGFRATGPGWGGTILDGGGYENTPSAGIVTGVTKAVEFYWDGVNIYAAVNGGSFVSKACTGLGTATADAFYVGAGYFALTSGNAGGYLDANVGSMGIRAGIPSNRSAVVSAMMTEYGAA